MFLLKGAEAENRDGFVSLDPLSNALDHGIKRLGGVGLGIVQFSRDCFNQLSLVHLYSPRVSP